MINSIDRIQKIATQKTNIISINTSLPISIKVTQKTSYNRYNLKFNNRNLSTKSVKQLKVGAEYWCEIESADEMIVIKNLFEKPEFNEFFLQEGLDLIEKLIANDGTEWFYKHVFNELAKPKNKESFEIYTNILLALQSGVINIAFIYNKIHGIFQLKKSTNIMQIYLVFSNFAPLYFEIKNGEIVKILTPFLKVKNALKSSFECEILIADIKPLWQSKNSIIDLKG